MEKTVEERSHRRLTVVLAEKRWLWPLKNSAVKFPESIVDACGFVGAVAMGDRVMLYGAQQKYLLGPQDPCLISNSGNRPVSFEWQDGTGQLPKALAEEITVRAPTHQRPKTAEASQKLNTQPLWEIHFGQDKISLRREDLLLVGRNSICDLNPQSARLSQFHCAIAVTQDHGTPILTIVDLGSTNGTRLDQTRIHTAQTLRATNLTVGGVRLRLLPHGTGSTNLCTLPSAAMKKVYLQVDRFAPSSEPVFVHGPSGCGKEGIARRVHQRSGRTGQLVAINAATLRYETAASELFGHVKGAFTGAHCDKSGAFREADGGTLFLDEVGDLSLEVQGDLLRVLQEKSVRPRGQVREFPVDTRLICATHRDLEEMVRLGKFREDLYHRLLVLPLRIPRLQQRPLDIAPLCDFFIAREFPGCSLSEDALNYLLRKPWPGNIRQLLSTLRVAFLNHEVMILEPKHLRSAEPPSTGQSTSISAAQKRARVVHILHQCGGDINEAARKLNLHRATIYRHLKASQMM